MKSGRNEIFFFGACQSLIAVYMKYPEMKLISGETHFIAVTEILFLETTPK